MFLYDFKTLICTGQREREIQADTQTDRSRGHSAPFSPTPNSDEICYWWCVDVQEILTPMQSPMGKTERDHCP